MSQELDQALWQIIKRNMGDNSLVLFKQFYEGEPIDEQFRGAIDRLYRH